MPLDRRRDQQSATPALIRGLAAACLLCLGAAGAARAQTSASLALLSEYAVRGIALSDGDPVLQLRVNHDGQAGWYMGGFATPASLEPGQRQAELIVYGGRAGRLPSGLSWDLGLKKAAFLRDHQYDYVEVHAGLAFDEASARLSLSPAYYGGPRTAYLDLNLAHPLSDAVGLNLHGGVLHAFGGERGRVDLGASLSVSVGDWLLHAGWRTLLRADRELPRARALYAGAALRF